MSFEVTPRFKSKFLYSGKIWVDANDFAVSRVAAQPAKNISFWISHTEIEHEYKKVGDFWLPASNSSITKVRFGGTAKLKIDYRDYRIGAAGPGLRSRRSCAQDGRRPASFGKTLIELPPTLPSPHTTSKD